MSEIRDRMKRLKRFLETDTGRAITHAFIGAFGAWLIIMCPPLGITFCIGFMFYEAIQDWRKGDKSFKDVFGFLVGFGILGGIYCIGR